MPQPLCTALNAAGVKTIFCGPLITPLHHHALARTCSSGESAINQALGNTIAGCRAAVCLSGIDLASALGPLIATAYTGCHRGLVILSFDGFRSSDIGTEFDSRPAAKLVELPVVEARNATETSALLLQCFAWSEGLGLPIILRLRPEHLQACQDDVPWELPQRAVHFLRKHNRWVTASHIAYARRRASHDRLRHFARDIETSPFDAATRGHSTGIVAVGTCCNLAEKVIELVNGEIDLMTLSSVWPLPTEHVSAWLASHQQVLIIENGQPFVEEQIMALAQNNGLRTRIYGQKSRHLREEGQPRLNQVLATVTELCPGLAVPQSEEEDDPYGEPDQLEESPFRPAFDALKKVIEEHIGRERVIITAEPGPLAGLNEMPYELVDVRYTRGASMALADGLRCNSYYPIICLTDRTAFLKNGLEQLAQTPQRKNPVITLLFWQDYPNDALNLELLMDATGKSYRIWYTDSNEDELVAWIEEAIEGKQDSILLVRSK